MPSQATRYLATAAITAAVAYLWDPANGRRRRARLADRLVRAASDIEDLAGAAARDLAHRGEGLAARARAAFEVDEANDEVLVERVRSALGRAVSHPGAIQVQVLNGEATLKGAVLEAERDGLLRTVSNVRGIVDVDDQLTVHHSAEGVPYLQGGTPPRLRRGQLMQENWSPATRAMTGSAGTLLFLWGLRNRGPLQALAAAAGGLLIGRSVTNVPLRRLAGRARRGIDIRKTITVNAPVERVFAALSDYTNFPTFMRNVRDVRLHGDGRSHWVVAGPAGTSIEWDAVTTRLEPNRLIAWRTMPRATVEHAGVIRLDEANGAGTLVDIRMSYNPPAGALGHVVARLFGADPKREMDEDLVRMKVFLETGKAPRDAAAPERAHARASRARDERPH